MGFARRWKGGSVNRHFFIAVTGEQAYILCTWVSLCSGLGRSKVIYVRAGTLAVRSVEPSLNKNVHFTNVYIIII